MTIVVNVKADDMRKMCEKEDVDVIGIEVPGAVDEAKAVCIKCGDTGAADLNEERFRAVVEGIVWTHKRMCMAADNDEDIREIELSALVDEATRAMTVGPDDNPETEETLP